MLSNRAAECQKKWHQELWPGWAGQEGSCMGCVSGIGQARCGGVVVGRHPRGHPRPRALDRLVMRLPHRVRVWTSKREQPGRHRSAVLRISWRSVVNSEIVLVATEAAGR